MSSDHILTVEQSGWSIKHPPRCLRDGDCAVHRAVAADLRLRGPGIPGRYYVALSGTAPGGFVTTPVDIDDPRVGALNTRGEWVPSIPEPEWRRSFGRDVALCPAPGCTFESVRRSPDEARTGYRGHYALVHVLGLS